MGKKDLTSLGDEIKGIVQNAVSSMDFHQLNKDIGNTVNSALDEVRKSVGMNHGSHQNWNRNPNPKPKQNHFNGVTNQNTKKIVPKSNVSNLCLPVGKTSGILLTVFGIIGIVLLGIAILVLSMIGIATGGHKLFGTIVIGLLPLLIGSVFMSAIGISIQKRIKRFRQYIALFRGHNYCAINELSSQIGQSEKYVIKDLRKMLSIGMFPQGHIDEQKTCFMLTNEIYEDYLKMQKNIRMQNLENEEKQKAMIKEEQNLNTTKSEGKESRNTIKEGRDYIQQIKEVNEAIPGEEISQKLYQLEKVTDKIFKYVELHPDQFCEIQKFMEYYLPTTLKLLNAYIEFDNPSFHGKNITTAKKEIEGTLDTINHAFEKLLDSLFEEAVMDVSTDISVLETILAQEGLTKKDFNIE